MAESPKHPVSSQDVQAVHRQAVEASLITPDHLYLDLSLLKDFRLGCLLSFVMERPLDQAQALYQRVQDGLKAYQMRHYHEVDAFFPSIGISDQQVEDRLNDPQWSDRIFALSPVTHFVHTLKAQLAININHSQVKEKFTKIPIGHKRYIRQYDDVTIYVNTHPLLLSQKSLDQIGAFMSDTYHVNTVILTTALFQLPLNVVQAFEELYVIDLGHLLANKAVNQAMADQKFLTKRIFAPMMFDRSKKITNTKQLNTEVTLIKATLDVLCMFDWISNAHFSSGLHLFDEADAPTAS